MNQAGPFSYEPPRLSIETGDLPERVTASVFLVQDGKLLLEKRPERPGIPSAGRWDTPGGHVDAGETPETTLVRELDEELGIRVHSFKLGRGAGRARPIHRTVLPPLPVHSRGLERGGGAARGSMPGLVCSGRRLLAACPQPAGGVRSGWFPSFRMAAGRGWDRSVEG